MVTCRFACSGHKLFGKLVVGAVRSFAKAGGPMIEALQALQEMLRQIGELAARRGAEAEAQTWSAWAHELGRWSQSVEQRIDHLEAEVAVLRHTLEETVDWANDLHRSLGNPPAAVGETEVADRAEPDATPDR